MRQDQGSCPCATADWRTVYRMARRSAAASEPAGRVRRRDSGTDAAVGNPVLVDVALDAARGMEFATRLMSAHRSGNSVRSRSRAPATSPRRNNSPTARSTRSARDTAAPGSSRRIASPCSPWRMKRCNCPASTNRSHSRSWSASWVIMLTTFAERERAVNVGELDRLEVGPLVATQYRANFAATIPRGPSRAASCTEGVPRRRPSPSHPPGPRQHSLRLDPLRPRGGGPSRCGEVWWRRRHSARRRGRWRGLRACDGPHEPLHRTNRRACCRRRGRAFLRLLTGSVRKGTMGVEAIGTCIEVKKPSLTWHVDLMSGDQDDRGTYCAPSRPRTRISGRRSTAGGPAPGGPHGATFRPATRSRS